MEEPLATGLRSRLREPILSSLMARRSVAWILTGTGLLMLLGVLLGFDPWPCPLFTRTGIPCPGCGLSRSMAATLHGDWAQVLSTHVLGPFFLLGAVLLVLAALLPRAARNALVRAVGRVERGTGITGLVLVALVGYWLVRLIALAASGSPV